MVVAKMSEECRQRLEENKKQMEALKLPKLSQSLRKSRKHVKPRSPAVEKHGQRSRRVAKMPSIVYREGLPVDLCKKNLPKNDGPITLVDEEGKESETIYLARRSGFSGGWKGFSVDHELTDGDAMVFQLISPTTLKVYIARASNYYDAE